MLPFAAGAGNSRMLSKLGSDLMCIHLKNEWTCLIIIYFPSCLVRAQRLPRPAEASGLWTGEFDSRRLTAGGAGAELGSPLKFLCHGPWHTIICVT